MNIVLSVFAVFVILLLSELGWRKHWFDNEFGRKFVHITVGSFVAFWPFFITWNQIRLLSLAFLVVVLISNYFKIFHAINSVQRPTYGEVFFALTVGLLTFITHSKGVYAAALLQMSLADGFAAIVGTQFGRDNKYHLFGHTKSVSGTMAFLVTSLVILSGYSVLSDNGLAGVLVIATAILAAAIENFAVFGLDNLVVPLFVGLLLANVK